MKKALSTIMSIAMVLVMTAALSANMFASALDNGSGSSDDPYRITNEDDFLEFVEESEYNSFENEFISLENSITVSEGFIGNIDCPFMGNFNGNGNTVEFTNDDFIGMFRYVENAVIENLTVIGDVYVENSSSERGNGVAGIVGVASGQTTITDCIFKGSVTNEYSGKDYSAGICGQASGNLTVSGCANYSDIEGNGSYLAGIVGYFSDGFVTVKNCTNYGDVAGNSYLAGIVGYVYNSGFSVNHCINAGKIDSYLHAGGIMNFKNTQNKKDEMCVMNCINRGAVYTSENLGYAAGIVGYLEDTVKDFSVLNCANFGAISGNRRNGGILAYWSSQSSAKLTLKNCYNGGAISGSITDALIGYYSGLLGDVISGNLFDTSKCSTTLSGNGKATGRESLTDAVSELNSFIDNNASAASGWFKWSVGYVNANGEVVASPTKNTVEQAVFEKDIPGFQGSDIGSVLSEGNLWVIIVIAVAAIAAIAVLVVVRKKKIAVTAGADNSNN